MSVPNKGRKRKIGGGDTDNDTDIELEIGMRIKSKLDDGEWYGGIVSNIGRTKGGGEEIVKIIIEYDDGDEEEYDWPDGDIVLDLAVENMEEKKEKRRRKGEVDKGSPRMFICGEEGCEYESKRKDHVKLHKAMVHDIDATYYFCSVDGCEYKAKDAKSVRTHKSAIHDIDVTYYVCNADGCEYKAEQSSNLIKHQKRIHGLS